MIWDFLREKFKFGQKNVELRDQNLNWKSPFLKNCLFTKGIINSANILSKRLFQIFIFKFFQHLYPLFQGFHQFQSVQYFFLHPFQSFLHFLVVFFVVDEVKVDLKNALDETEQRHNEDETDQKFWKYFSKTFSRRFWMLIYFQQQRFFCRKSIFVVQRTKNLEKDKKCLKILIC